MGMGVLRCAIACFLSYALTIFAAEAQQHRFLYLQTDNGQPFYLRYSGRHYSSSVSGFLILSRLKDSVLDLTVGFPRNMYPEQRYLVGTAGRDRGMVLKLQGDGRWALVDLHTMDVLQGDFKEPGASYVSKPTVQPVATDSFTAILSSAIGDSSLMGGVVSEDVRLRPQSGSRIVEGATDSLRSDSSAKAGESVSVLAKGEVVSTSDSSGLPKGGTVVPVMETVRSDAPSYRTSMDSAVSVTKGTDTVTSSVSAPDPPKAAVPASNVSKPDRTDCRSSESVQQLGDLRRRMESLRDEDAKVAEALREIKLRCFTAVQVRSLLVVFEREEGRYKMLDAAYPHVRDPSGYPALLPILTDPYFIHRFKRLTGMPIE